MFAFPIVIRCDIRLGITRRYLVKRIERTYSLAGGKVFSLYVAA